MKSDLSKITKNNILGHLKGEAVGLSDGDSKILLSEFFTALSEEVIKGNTVKFNKFGTFKSASQKPRKAKNFQTGEVIYTNKKQIIKFIPSKAD